MQKTVLTLSVVIPTYRRERVLIETARALLKLGHMTPGFIELIVIDQTERHEASTENQLLQWDSNGVIKWLRLDKPHLTQAMNLGLLKALGDVVLFTDDDIIPAPFLLEGHLAAYRDAVDIWGVVGQILQPGQIPEEIPFTPSGGKLRRFLDFPFRSRKGMCIENAMAGNFSMKREKALSLGGFDENFIPPVAARFETEFAKRLVAQGGKIWFAPRASIHHLYSNSGGTRSFGGHLNSISPRYGVGDYYFALRCGQGWEKIWYIVKRPFRQIRTRFHLRHPWWIPLKFIGEIRAVLQAIYLYYQDPKLLR